MCRFEGHFVSACRSNPEISSASTVPIVAPSSYMYSYLFVLHVLLTTIHVWMLRDHCFIFVEFTTNHGDADC